MSRLIKPIGTRKSSFIPPDEAMRRLDEMVVAETDLNSAIKAPTGDFSIEELPDRYRLHNVVYRNRLYAVDWSKELLDGGADSTQDEWVFFTQNTEFKLPDAPLCYASVRALYLNQDHPDAEQKRLVEKAKQEVFRTDIEDVHSTSTRIEYSRSIDKAIHNAGYTDEYFVLENYIAGPNEWVNQEALGLEGPIRAILGTDNLAEVEKVYKWLSGHKTCLWRWSRKPEEYFLQAVVLGLGGPKDRFNIDAKFDISDGALARGAIARLEPHD